MGWYDDGSEEQHQMELARKKRIRDEKLKRDEEDRKVAEAFLR